MTAHALAAAENAAAKMTVKVLRAGTGSGDVGLVRALDQKGSPVGEAKFAFGMDSLPYMAVFARDGSRVWDSDAHTLKGNTAMLGAMALSQDRKSVV